MYHGSYEGVSSVLHGIYKNITRVLHWCFNKVIWVILGRHNGFSWVFQCSDMQECHIRSDKSKVTSQELLDRGEKSRVII